MMHLMHDQTEAAPQQSGLEAWVDPSSTGVLFDSILKAWGRVTGLLGELVSQERVVACIAASTAFCISSSNCG
jgi:hypothetical protein